MFRQSRSSRDGGGLVSLRIFNSKKPVIGVINGPAVGVGVTMTLPMDFRLASDTAKFGFVLPNAALSLKRVLHISCLA